MRSLKAIGTLLMVSVLVLAHAGPASAITGSKGGDVSTGKGKEGGSTNGGGGSSSSGGGGKTETSVTEGGGNRAVDRPSKGHPNVFCEKPDPRVLSSEGTLVGHVFKVDCKDDGTTYYKVNLVPPFDSEAHRVTFKSDVRPCACYPVRLKLDDHGVKKLIWMHARH